MSNKKAQPQPMPQPHKLASRIPTWVYLLTAVVLIIALASKIPGGQDLPVLIPWILGWGVTIWLFRRFRWVRILVIIGLIIIALGAIIIISAGQAGKLFYGH